MFNNLTPAEYEVLLRHDFTTFAGRCFQDLNPQTCLATNWHLEVIAAHHSRLEFRAVLFPLDAHVSRPFGPVSL
jgi:hypothetical protein